MCWPARDGFGGQVSDLSLLFRIALDGCARYPKQQETSGFVRQEILDLLAYFYWKRLPEQVILWITDRIDLSQETAAQELAFPTRCATSLLKS